MPIKNQFDLQAIRELAYRLWESRGRRDGHAHDDWLEAERQVMESNRGSKRARKRAKAAASVKAPIVPLDENSNTPPELPKVGSRDAPGG